MKTQTLSMMLGVLAMMMFSTDPAAAQSGGPFEIVSYTIDGGGVTSTTGGVFELGGTIGQPDASDTMSGGDFELTGGFWATVNVVPCLVDLTGDGNVDIFDVLAFVDAYNNADLIVDYNGDNVINIFDVLAFVDLYNAGCP
jgi:hypothetical protein